ncbi:MAG TPA: S9 family peptidase [Blastocatellia bacterium]|jgi:dipeptidyl aminopeptidase/acylaminoacyl peptidase|nr:S9 family peptidase [Blastocatellia bacterium]
MRRRIAWLLLILIVAAGSAHAQKRAFTVEDLYRVKSISDVHISPDGKSIVYTVATSDLPQARRVSNIWVMDIDGRNARQLTQGEKSSSSPLFSPDGKWISFISAKDGAANLYVMPSAGGEARKLTNVSTGVSDPLWSPDSRWIAFSTDVYPECGGDDACNKRTAETWSNGPLKAHMADDLLYRHWTDWKDGTRTHIFLAGARTGEVRDLTPGNFDSPAFQLSGPLQYDFSPDGTEFVYASNHDKNLASSTNNDLWLVSLTGGQAQARNITASNPAYDGSPKYSPDGKYIAYRMQKQPAYESDLFRLVIYDRASGASTVLSEAYRDWIEEFEWSADSKSIYFSGPLKGLTPIHRLDVGTRGITEVLADATILEFHMGAGRVVYTRSSVAEPVEIYSAQVREGKASAPARLTRINEPVASAVDIRPAEQMWVEGAGGARIHVYVVKPHNFDPSKKYPLILNVHGGPQSMWGDAFRGDWQVYPGAGYVVAFSNPHGSTGYGQDFTAAISNDWGGKVYEDLMKVTDALERLPYVDASRMGAMGWSYGGYMMNWFEGHTDRFKAIATMMGIYNLESFYGATEELWFPEWDFNARPGNAAEYRKWSPSEYVKNFKTPCLVISGERDYRVPYTQSIEMFTALQKMGVPSRLIIYSNAGHWPSWYEMALYYTAHLEWFQKYLGGGGPQWTTEQFLRNAVFDRASGRRLVNEPENGMSGSPKPAMQEKKPGQEKPPKNLQGKPDRKP